MGWKFLSGNDNIQNEAHIASNITFFLKNAEIVYSFNEYHPPPTVTLATML